MTQRNKVILAEITIVSVLLLAVLLPQLIGSNQTEKAVRKYDTTDELNKESITLGTVAGEILEAYTEFALAVSQGRTDVLVGAFV